MALRNDAVRLGRGSPAAALQRTAPHHSLAESERQALLKMRHRGDGRPTVPWNDSPPSVSSIRDGDGHPALPVAAVTEAADSTGDSGPRPTEQRAACPVRGTARRELPLAGPSIRTVGPPGLLCSPGSLCPEDQGTVRWQRNLTGQLVPLAVDMAPGDLGHGGRGRGGVHRCEAALEGA